MVSPHELKNKPFGKSIKGYNPAEVDDYIEFLLEKYSEAYRENNELERKLRVAATSLDEIKDEEESIRRTLVSAQKMGEKIVRDANEKADVITGAIKDRCDAVISEFKEQLQLEKEEMWTIRTRILDFKKNVFDLYKEHIEELQGLSVNDIAEIVLPNEDAIVSKIYSDVKSTLETEIIKENAEETLEEKRIEISDEIVSDAEYSGKAANNEEGDYIDELMSADISEEEDLAEPDELQDDSQGEEGQEPEL